ncbi:hypothetical protein CO112_04150 [Candidatus Dojkabacteria bacterium CG_4_9_14_3_um_filter_150_Dojkabacteria_WS6_41_13]|uniref:NAD(+) kinase n=1 Tax=Candidatus Dojkabacteria bacterium CG_4_10_14_0_2_um_filter_Dojkabacteria_WS6_41_15 TaxID=2014249 RepID=A0A2M7W2H5_9BACT|nr:MAG: hypothetical protein COZ14_01580 [Candidatus Dojkabacteria bacterium CG_4_10_14_3_um_filter_Dojkabacteria_WS6_41_9]PJA14770.1 MAG: hypothetical protein COX64_01630 [Candidatus Dojkabacteria bacterium CG_4_10_14_0_2_um_filter_Dojkabacteria_WS6_41_15]PJB22502.1 MAG: hypothetical protein CO112_04150 [Candidatus Dojkabacteria bacterium CG_4_9_14_3_um_filter_150_Dojkabacteria_WS6_41_13]
MKIYYEPSPDPRVSDFNNLIADRFPEFLKEEKPEVILVAGGDGAMHHATKKFPHYEGIYLGKGLGTLNFLMNEIADDIGTLEKLQRDRLELTIISTATIAVSINGSAVGYAANDIVFGDSINGYHTFALSTSDGSFDKFTLKGTGMCIATPLGSTAYNFNNGGVILPLESNLWSMTGIVCNKYINDIITAQETKIWVSDGTLFLDGIETKQLASTDEVLLGIGNPVKIGFLDPHRFMKRRIEMANRMRKGTI